MHFLAACFLKPQTAAEIWKYIQNRWIPTYLGPPDSLEVELGSAYISKETRSIVEAAGIKVEDAAIENPGSIGTVERYHGPLRAAYKKLIKTL